MTYAELQLAVANYMHRVDLATQIPDFIELARQRINRDLRVREMLVAATLTPTQNPEDLPADFLEMRDLYHDKGTRRITMTMVGNRQLNAYSNSSGGAGNTPGFYSVDGVTLATAPGGIGVDFKLLYYGQQPALVGDTDTNATMSRFATIWLYGSLIEGHAYTQDMDLRESALQAYTSEVTQANSQAAKAESGASLQMAGASAWL